MLLNCKRQPTIRLYNFTLTSNPFIIVEYTAKPGLGVRILSPGLTKLVKAISTAPEQPVVKITSYQKCTIRVDYIHYLIFLVVEIHFIYISQMVIVCTFTRNTAYFFKHYDIDWRRKYT